MTRILYHSASRAFGSFGTTNAERREQTKSPPKNKKPQLKNTAAGPNPDSKKLIILKLERTYVRNIVPTNTD